MTTTDFSLLNQLCQAVAPPGNETPVRHIMANNLAEHGKLHQTAWTDLYCYHKNNKGNRPLVALCCHMDSPGFVVKQVEDDGSLTLITLGGIRPSVANLRMVKLRTSQKTYDGLITVIGDAEERNPDYRGDFGFVSGEEALASGVCKGDAVAFSGELRKIGSLLEAPHLDNRLGCFTVLTLAEALKDISLDVDLVFIATSCEEVSLQRGASTLSKLVQPDLAILFDATYEENDVKMGLGPVLTLFDNSVLIPMELRDTIRTILNQANLPLQYEVYNYAGTDASSFGVIEGGCITLPLLLATLNNHTPHEMFQPRDFNNLLKVTIYLLKNAQKLLRYE
jgi:putative aminopeptidase FrvX